MDAPLSNYSGKAVSCNVGKVTYHAVIYSATIQMHKYNNDAEQLCLEDSINVFWMGSM